ncbi:hypothetical protein F0562_015677 [Nyssa sinensis]|uniref:Uncharacterized protein n=1 Tax=Nyssa sinensis TaxID=561372 RepID=A0A5J4ZHL9_9ASTE|nr:hypothetical protein F0562_015677 [Nyssa sinensis]
MISSPIVRKNLRLSRRKPSLRRLFNVFWATLHSNQEWVQVVVLYGPRVDISISGQCPPLYSTSCISRALNTFSAVRSHRCSCVFLSASSLLRYAWTRENTLQFTFPTLYLHWDSCFFH